MSPRCAWVLLLVLSAAPAAAEESIELYGCSYVGQRGNVLVLANMDGTSYVKLGAQRVPAEHVVANGTRRWRFGGNSVVLQSDGIAEYFEGSEDGGPKARFRCKAMG